ncbi:hypothetical protein PAEPH01_2352, partial [Pancytospora epiphaga]
NIISRLFLSNTNISKRFACIFITLLNIFAKILASKLQYVCIVYNLIQREQAGFINDKECLAQAAGLINRCQRRRILGKDTVLCFLNLK